MTDKLYDTVEKKKEAEDYKEAEDFFLRKKAEDCCVCFEINIVKTKCGHNLCRSCAFKLFDKFDCPICREKLGCSCMDCESDDESDNEEHEELPYNEDDLGRLEAEAEEEDDDEEEIVLQQSNVIQ
jgi:hypothetical protein